MSGDNVETFAFQAEINQLMSLIINTFYSNKDVFLRELISNASDALDKIRHASLTESSVLDSNSNLEIKLIPDKENNTLTIEDSGIGMTKEELINNLGTIANSGTKKFIESLQAGADVSCIGQFGVGFYSGFLVADKVEVISKHNDDSEYCWSSNAGGTFNISESSTGIKRGTKLVLHLKDDQKEYLEENKIRELIKKHSQFIAYPISLFVTKTVDTEVEDTEEVIEEEIDENDAPKIEEIEEEDDSIKSKKMKTVSETVSEFEELNTEKPLWLKKEDNVSKEEYVSFYKHISNDYDEYLKVKQFSIEGQIEFKSLLFVPKNPPLNMFDTQQKMNNLKLYVRRVFITDDCEHLCPEWLSFVKGVIDSEDLPLNISREILQRSQILKIMKKNVTKKCIEMFNEIAENEEEYMHFYNNFSKNIKLGVHSAENEREKLTKLLRYETSKSEGKKQSLSDYVSRMKENQKDIYVIIGESKQSIENSPLLEQLKKKDFEIIYMDEPIDEYMLNVIKEFEGKKLVDVSRTGLNLLDDEEQKTMQELKEKFKDLCTNIKEVLKDSIDNVEITFRLNETPCALVSNAYGHTANMNRIMKAQALQTNQMMMGNSKPIMEINPHHKIIKQLDVKLKNTTEDKKIVHDIIHLMLDSACVASGFSLSNSLAFSKRINRIVQVGLDCEDDDTFKDVSENVSENTCDNCDCHNNDNAELVEEESTMEEVD